MKVPFFRVELPETAVEAVAESLRSGWLTTGFKTKTFEEQFAARVNTTHALALTSCTAALHLALEAMGVQRGDLVLVPTMTFAATAEVVRYFDAVPVFVDMDDNFNMDPVKLDETIRAIRANQPVAGLEPPYGPIRLIVVMHYGGFACDINAIQTVALQHEIPFIEDAAHTFPAYYRHEENIPWRHCGTFGQMGCFSFYANKCITTGEGGMVIARDGEKMDRMRVMSLHGMNRDAWKRYTSAGSWYYEIVAPGYKYNMTDIAASLGLDELIRADDYLAKRAHVAAVYDKRLGQLDAIQLPPRDPATRKHSWHLYSIRLNLDALSIDRAQFIEALREREIYCSMHWLPLHLMPYYRETYGYDNGLFPTAERDWKRQVSLPIFPAQTEEEIDAVCSAIEEVTEVYRS
ncbi:DegT/DnrJ/EryC1/StrS family aminotransferase [bacterium]|nr:DegT/DnrJ/EryC1/StrS family aminotransferase [bacterium]